MSNAEGDRKDATPHAHLSRADRLAAVMADVEERLEREVAHETAQRQPA